MAVLDTSVVVDLDDPAVVAVLPDETAISCVTLAELHFGVLRATHKARARRLALFARVTSLFEPLPISQDTALAWGEMAALVRSKGANPRPRANDLWIAATAAAENAELLTRNPGDFRHLRSLVDVRAV